MNLLPPLDAVAVALAELGSVEAEAGEYVRCLVCQGKRLAVWAPGVIRCEVCRTVAVFQGVREGAVPQRLACRRRCRRRVSYLLAGEGSRPASVRCVECGEERPAPFAVDRYGIASAGVRPWVPKWRSSMALARRKAKRMRERETEARLLREDSSSPFTDT